MCLSTITKTYNPPNPTVRVAWKYVEINFNGNPAPIFKSYLLSEYSYEWQKATTKTLSTTYIRGEWGRDNYESGFHVFPTREDARKAKRALLCNDYGTFSQKNGGGTIKLAKVEVRNVTTEGFDGTSSERSFLGAEIKNLVAQEMRIVQIVTKG